MAYGIYVNSDDGDYVLKNGYVQNESAILTEAYMRIACPLGKYINKPEFGSEVHTMFNSRANITKNRFIQILQDSLQPMLISGKVSSIKIDILSAIFGKYKAQIYLVDHTNTPISFIWEALTS